MIAQQPSSATRCATHILDRNLPPRWTTPRGRRMKKYHSTLINAKLKVNSTVCLRLHHSALVGGTQNGRHRDHHQSPLQTQMSRKIAEDPNHFCHTIRLKYLEPQSRCLTPPSIIQTLSWKCPFLNHHTNQNSQHGLRHEGLDSDEPHPGRAWRNVWMSSFSQRKA